MRPTWNTRTGRPCRCTASPRTSATAPTARMPSWGFHRPAGTARSAARTTSRSTPRGRSSSASRRRPPTPCTARAASSTLPCTLTSGPRWRGFHCWAWRPSRVSASPRTARAAARTYCRSSTRCSRATRPPTWTTPERMPWPSEAAAARRSRTGRATPQTRPCRAGGRRGRWPLPRTLRYAAPRCPCLRPPAAPLPPRSTSPARATLRSSRRKAARTRS